MTVTVVQSRHPGVLVVDDHGVFADALAQALRVAGFEEIATAATPAAALIALADGPPSGRGIALVDVDLGGEDGLGLVPRIVAHHPGIRCLVLTAHPRPDVVRRARAVGAYGVLAKGLRLDEVVDAITATAGLGEGDFLATSPAVEDDDEQDALTAREVEILQLLAAGQDARGVARVLELSPHTVRDHLKAARRKLGVHSQLDAVVAAYRRGLVDLHAP